MSLDPLAPGTLALAEEFGLSRDEYDLVIEKLGRTPNVTELGVFSVMWSEHCSYKSSRVHLAKFPTKAPHVIYGPGENAGAIDIGEGLAAIFKMESHNHPSFIEPFQGAATGVGATQRWHDGDMRGELLVTEFRPGEYLEYKLEMEPGGIRLRGSLRIELVGAGSRISWSCWGDAGDNPIDKLMMRVYSPMIGSDFSAGLANLKARFH